MPDRGHGVGRGTTNRNSRGGSDERRKRKLWLLATFGDGIKAPCSYCQQMVDYDTISVDRYPVMGCDGGTYRRENIRPACRYERSLARARRHGPAGQLQQAGQGR